MYIQAEIFLAKNMPDEADRILEEAVALADEDDLDNSLLDAANILFDYGYYELANEWIRKVGDKSSEDYIELKVKILSNQGEIDRAERLLNKLIDNNYHEMREILSQAKPPCLPYVGMFLTDLIFVNGIFFFFF